MDNTWLTQAKRLQAIASTGLHFCRDEYDRERYQEIADIAHRMLAELGGVPPARILELVSDFAQGYATPKVDVRGALIEHDRILLVREKSDGCWTLPGGYADVGLSPAENVIRKSAKKRASPCTPRACTACATRPSANTSPTCGISTSCSSCARATAMSARRRAWKRWTPTSSRPTGCRCRRGRVVESDIQAAFAFRADEARAAAFD